MKTNVMKSALIAVSALFTSFSANAALIGILPATPGGTDYQAYYEDVLDFSITADANLPFTSGYAPNGGLMSWASANAWAAQLTINGVGGWVLPDVIQPDPGCSIQAGSDSYGYGCSSIMMVFFEDVLGGVPGTNLATTHNSNYNLFPNIEAGAYWNATSYAGGIDSLAWISVMIDGVQLLTDKNDPNIYAWAIHPGNAAAVSSVPVPAAIWLFMAGLLGLVAVARRKA